MSIISFIFQLSDHIVEFLGGGFLWLVHGLMSVIAKGFSAFFSTLSPESSTYGAIWIFFTVMIFIIAIAALYFAPWLLFIFAIVIPISLILLKYTLGWLILLGITYFLYRMGKSLVYKLHAQLNKIRVQRGEKHES